MAKIYKFDELADHKDRNDCWVLIDGKVYDVTTFLSEHPGGDRTLISAAGKDATFEFEDVGHTPGARELMQKYYIGDIATNSIPIDKKVYDTSDKEAQPAARKHKNINGDGFLINLLKLLLPLVLLAVAFAWRSAIKKD